MTERKRGVCVGGPLDGKFVSYDGTVFYASEDAKPLSKICGECGGSRKLKPYELERKYRFIQIGDPGGFWLHQTLNVTDAILEMAGAYEREHIAKRERAS